MLLRVTVRTEGCRWKRSPRYSPVHSMDGVSGFPFLFKFISARSPEVTKKKRKHFQQWYGRADARFARANNFSNDRCWCAKHIDERWNSHCRINVTLATKQRLSWAPGCPLPDLDSYVAAVYHREDRRTSYSRIIRISGGTGIDPRRCLGKVAADPLSEIAQAIAAVSRIADPVS